MNKEITLEEYVLTNLHPGDWGYYIRLKDNIEYQVYKRKPRGQKLYYFIKKDNEEIRLDEEVRKCFLQSKREYERYRNMKNYFKEAEKIIKQEKNKNIVDKNYIPVQKVKDKISERQFELQQEYKDFEDDAIVLQELLEGRK